MLEIDTGDTWTFRNSSC